MKSPLTGPPSVYLNKTAKFSVLEIGRDVFDCSLLRVCTKSLSLEALTEKFATKLSVYGGCILNDVVPEKNLEQVTRKFSPFFARIKKSFDDFSDEFTFSQTYLDEIGVTRLPRIGRGKHNIHFDPHESEYHAVLAELADAANISDILSHYTNKLCCLRESGLTVTHPQLQLVLPGHVPTGNNDDNGQGITPPEEKETNDGKPVNNHNAKRQYGAKSNTTGAKYVHTDNGDILVPGDGMEWHSDGEEGEFTVLLALEDIDHEVGSLGVVPSSHVEFVPGVGHGNIMNADYRDRELRYAYRAGHPLIIDARTIHGVSNNVSDRWRFVIWYIFDCY